MFFGTAATAINRKATAATCKVGESIAADFITRSISHIANAIPYFVLILFLLSANGGYRYHPIVLEDTIVDYFRYTMISFF